MQPEGGCGGLSNFNIFHRYQDTASSFQVDVGDTSTPCLVIRVSLGFSTPGMAEGVCGFQYTGTV